MYAAHRTLSRGLLYITGPGRAFVGTAHGEEANEAVLLAENERLHRDFAILKKIRGLVCPGESVRTVSVYRFKEVNRAEFTVADMARLLEF